MVDLDINGLHPDTGEPVLPPLGLDDVGLALAGRVAEAPHAEALAALLAALDGAAAPAGAADDEREARAARHDLLALHHRATAGTLGPRFGVDPEDLRQARYALLLPQPADEREALHQAACVEALAPLLALRAEEQGAPVEHVLLPPGATVTGLLASRGTARGQADPERLPYYLLLLADPGRVSFAFQHQLDVDRAVGRVDPASPEDLHAWALALAAPRARARAVDFWAPTHDRATRASRDGLVQPLAEGLAPEVARRRVEGEAATPQALLDLLADPDPALLLAACHGAALPAEDARQRELQGALMAHRPEGVPMGPEWRLAGADLPEGLDLSGRFITLFACFGGGTPEHDTFLHALSGRPKAQRVRLASAPFIAELPRRLLARGALGVLAHVDRAWDFSFRSWNPDGSVTPQVAHFAGLLGRLLAGGRAGHALDDFGAWHGSLAAALVEIEELLELGLDVDPRQRAFSWIRTQDARAYALLGCPAARLTFAPEAPPAAPGELTDPG